MDNINLALMNLDIDLIKQTSVMQDICLQSVDTYWFTFDVH